MPGLTLSVIAALGALVVLGASAWLMAVALGLVPSGPDPFHSYLAGDAAAFLGFVVAVAATATVMRLRGRPFRRRGRLKRSTRASRAGRGQRAAPR